MSVVVVPYDPNWPQVYEELRSQIWPAVQHFALRIEHVGSTSVPGLAAKPVIDIDIVVDTPENSNRAVEELRKLGYEHLGCLGLEGREAMRAQADFPRHNLYVCLEDSEPYQNHVHVRNYLRENPAAVEEYGNLKLSLASQFPEDIDSYIDGKTDLLLDILRKSGFNESALARAEAINRKPSGTLILVVGLPGSGKTTLAKRLEAERRAIRMCPDDWIEAILKSPDDVEERDRLRDPIEQLQWNIAQTYLRKGLTVILENGFWGADERANYAAIAKELGAKVEVRYLEAPNYEELWARVQQRNQTLAGSPWIMPESDLRSCWNLIQIPSAEELTTYDAGVVVPWPSSA